MDTRSMQICGVVFMILIMLVVGCGGQAEPQAAAPAVDPVVVQETVVVVVTATQEPPTPTKEVIYVVVTEASGAAASGAENEAVEQPTAVPTATSQAVAEGAQEIAEAPADDPQEIAVEMSLTSQKTTTQHSPRPEPFVVPQSIEEFLPPNSWSDIGPDQTTEFQSYDGIRVLDGGQAVLDLGDLMRLVLKHDSELQTVPGSLVREELNKISVDFDKSPLLQQIALAAHLFRGGFLGEKTVGDEPVALTTPNAVILISGTTFLLVYDPDDEVTYVGNFEGTIDVADVALEAGELLPDRKLFAIPPVRNRKEWPLHPHMTLDEFSRLIDLQESPIAAADMVSGPYLVVKFNPELTVRNGPGTEYTYVGTIEKGHYARIIGRGGGWWQIECPENLRGPDCWVSGGSTYVDDYNIDLYPVPNTAPAAAPTAAPPGPRSHNATTPPPRMETSLIVDTSATINLNGIPPLARAPKLVSGSRAAR